jgi:translation initiation factor 2 gamma subunit (eIF-2gamma)
VYLANAGVDYTLRSSLVVGRFKNELERNITIKLGYANAKIYKSGKGFATFLFVLERICGLDKWD